MPPAQAHIAALTGALGDFGRVNLDAASAGETSVAGETLMRRALGAAADGPTAVPAGFTGAPAPSLSPASRPAGPRTYMLSRPLRETVKLGPVALAAHTLYEAAILSFKAWIIWKATHSPTAAAVATVVELATSTPVWMPFRTMLDLGQRYWRRKLAVLRELARTPGIDRVRVLTTGKVRFLGPFAQRRDNTGLIFVEASSELPAEVGHFGAPIPIENVEAQHVRVTLASPGAVAATAWTPTLSYLLEGHSIPPGIAAAWRAALNPGKASIKRMLNAAKSASLRLDATLVGPDGSEKPLGALAEGPAVKILIGLGHLDRVRGWLGWSRSTRKLPVSDTRVERPGDAREAGWRAAFRRAWRRLTGGLIVASGRS